MSGFLVQPRGPRGPKSNTEASYLIVFAYQTWSGEKLLISPRMPWYKLAHSLGRCTIQTQINSRLNTQPSLLLFPEKEKKVSIQLKIKGSKRNPILLGWWDVVTSSSGSLLHALYISFSSIAAIQNHLWYMLSHSLMRLSSIHGFLCHNNSDSGYFIWK